MLRLGAWPWWLCHSPTQKQEQEQEQGASNLSGFSGPECTASCGLPLEGPGLADGLEVSDVVPVAPPTPKYGKGRRAQEVIVPVDMGICGLRRRGKSRYC